MAIIYGARTDRLINAADGVTNDADTILGDGEAETIYGLGGDDMIKGGGGADRLYGGAGIDTAIYIDSSEGVVVSLTAGRGAGGSAEGDQLYQIENVTGSDHRDELYGDANDNILRGEGGSDLIKGGGGSDRLYGGADGDSLVIDGLDGDYVDGGEGNDTLSFEVASDGGFRHSGINVDLSSGHFSWGLRLGPGARDEPPNIANIENVAGTQWSDTMVGNGADNILLGYGGLDRLHGGAGADIIDGGDGTDFVWGEAGNDHLWGGDGDDQFYFQRNEGSTDLGHDVIYDFGGGDRIVVDDTISYASLRASMHQVGDDVVIALDAHNSITIDNFRVSWITSADFLFE